MSKKHNYKESKLHVEHNKAMILHKLNYLSQIYLNWRRPRKQARNNYRNNVDKHIIKQNLQNCL